MTIASSKPNITSPQSTPLKAKKLTTSDTEMRVLLEGVSWETYKRLLTETGDNRKQRFAYRDGLLEIMVPLKGHEEPTRLFDQFLAAIVDALGVEFCSLGALTMKNVQQKKGLEPDGCFYIANEAVVRGVETLDFEVHPPPDLVVEVDNSSSSLGKFPIYEALKIPEIWRLQRGVLTIYQLGTEGSGYAETEQSLSFPQLPIRELPQFIARAKVIGQRAAVRELVQRVRQALGDSEKS
ncbi:MAG: Uma2 family endonuclease [Leptolyngbya sp. RL_3_1]|nr:Uma2 family endonuclease [Leptolyngbya sp. RL_3_1]